MYFCNVLVISVCTLPPNTVCYVKRYFNYKTVFDTILYRLKTIHSYDIYYLQLGNYEYINQIHIRIISLWLSKFYFFKADDNYIDYRYSVMDTIFLVFIILLRLGSIRSSLFMIPYLFICVLRIFVQQHVLRPIWNWHRNPFWQMYKQAPPFPLGV